MICKNCGAEYEDNLIECPFCRAENVAESYRRQASYVNDLKRKSDFLAVLPDWIVGLLGKVMKHTAVFAVGLFLIVLLIAFLGTKIYSSTAIWRMERNIAKLEKLYEAADYEKLQDVYYDMEDTYGGSYEKYYRTVNVYSRMDWVMYNMEKLSDKYVQFLTVEEVEDMLESLMSVLYAIDEMEAAGFPYGEEKAMQQFEKTLLDGVEQHIPMDEVEFQAAYDKYLEDEKNDYSQEAALILERVTGEE